MRIEHVAIWTHDLERSRYFYETYFGGTANAKYVNPRKQFESYFLTFADGARLELMQMPAVPPSKNDVEQQRLMPLAELKTALRIVPGQKIAYVTDVAWHQDNVKRIVELARDSDLLFIEAVFLERDAEHGLRKFHLTARQAGEIARAANAGCVIPLHFSPRYVGDDRASLRAEVAAEFGGKVL